MAWSGTRLGGLDRRANGVIHILVSIDVSSFDEELSFPAKMKPSGKFGVTTVAKGSKSSFNVEMASVSSKV